MDFDVRVLNATGSRTLANVCWFLRHPVHATRWWLRNGTLYAFIVVPLVVIATACASTGLTVKQAATIGLQSSETALEATQGLERSLCFVNPATESGTHCTNPIAAPPRFFTNAAPCEPGRTTTRMPATTIPYTRKSLTAFTIHPLCISR